MPTFPEKFIQGRTALRAGQYDTAWELLNSVDPVPDFPELNKAKANCALRIALSLESNRSLFGTDWDKVAMWRRSAAGFLPDHLANRILLVLALLYGEREDEARAAAAATPHAMQASLQAGIGAALDVIPALRRATGRIYGQHAAPYLSRGLPVVPCLGKLAIFDGWRRYATEMPAPDLIAAWAAMPFAQIGLVLGPVSGIAVLDIDTPDTRLATAIAAALPPSPWQLKAWHGIALAFRHSNAAPVRGRLSDGTLVFDLLGAGRRVSIPPSIHPTTGEPYTANCALTEVLTALPALPADYADRIVAAARQEGFEVHIK